MRTTSEVPVRRRTRWPQMLRTLGAVGTLAVVGTVYVQAQPVVSTGGFLQSMSLTRNDFRRDQGTRYWGESLSDRTALTAWRRTREGDCFPEITMELVPAVVSEEDAVAALTLTFTVDGEVPTPGFDVKGTLITGGLSMRLDGRAFNAILRQSSGDPVLDGLAIGKVVDSESGTVELILLQQTSTITFHIFNDVVQEADQRYTFRILPNDAYAMGSHYVINPAAGRATVTLIDGNGGPGVGPSVDFSGSQTELHEGDTFTMSFRVEGDIPAAGLQVLVVSPTVGALREFAIADEDGNLAVELRGISEFLEVDDSGASGFLVTIIEPSASITLSALADGLNEGRETLTFDLVDGEVYEVEPNSSRVRVTLHDERDLPTLPAELIAALDATLDRSRPREVPGAAVAILSPAGQWFGASGVANVAKRTPLQPDDRFEAGSITKTFVAATILLLVEEGRLALDDTLTDWLSTAITDLVPNAGQITIKHLLSHTSGVADYLNFLVARARIDPTLYLQAWQLEQLVHFIDGVGYYFAPGQSWWYSNTNYILAGLVMEAVTGKNYARAVRDRILTPLNLQNTFFAQEHIPGGYIKGYWDMNGDGTLDDIRFTNLAWAGSAGSLISNTADLAAFFDALFKGNLLQPETLAQMLATIPVTSLNYSTYGLGIGTLIYRNRAWYAHRGQTLGFRANLWYSPDADITYVELINGRSNANLSLNLLSTFLSGINNGQTATFTAVPASGLP